jgi:hypothetical protein
MRLPGPFAGGLLLGALACASSQAQTIDAAMASNRPPRTILVATSPLPRMGAGPETLLFPSLAGIAVASAVSADRTLGRGDELIASHKIVDPAPELGRALTVALAMRRHLEVKPARQIDSTRTVRKYFQADLVLDVATVFWGVQAIGDRYRFVYRAHLEVFDTRTYETLAADDCEAPVLKQAAALTWDELEGNDAKLFKDEVGYAANYCRRYFARQLRVWLYDKHALYGETDPPRRDEDPARHEFLPERR